MLSSLGADSVGVEVNPLFQALYSQPDDQGTVQGGSGVGGHLKLLLGKFPADAELAEAVGGGYDLFISKNVLKRGYIHPAKKVDPRMTIQLGVDDKVYVQAMHSMLNCGGLAIIYNICPAMAKQDDPYIPWADGRCPFDRTLLEDAGFEVLAYDQDDSLAIHEFWMTLNLNRGQDRAALGKTIFATYTLIRKR